MRAFTFRETIARTPQQVWDVLVNLDLASRWRPMIKAMATEDGQPLRVGSQVRLTVEFMGRTQVSVSTAVAFDPPRRWSLHSAQNPAMEGLFEFVLEPRGAGTLVTATCDLTSHGFLPWLFLPLIARGERRHRGDMLGNLKRLVEGGSVQ